MCIEKRDGGVYYICNLPIVKCDVSSLAVYNLRWYCGYISQRLDSSRYALRITRKMCLLTVKITESEYSDIQKRESIIGYANSLIFEIKDDFDALALGKIPSGLREKYIKENGEILREWAEFKE